MKMTVKEHIENQINLGNFKRNIYTPDNVINTMLLNKTIDTNVLVLFNLEVAITLVEDYNVDQAEITFYSDDPMMIKTANILKYKTIKDLDASMKFDATILNPPYNGVSALHQKFFNKAVELTKDGGSVIAIQPATAYLSKKPNQKAPNVEMQNNIRKYKTDVRMVNGFIFESAKVATTLSITHLVKSESDTISLEYLNGVKYSNINLSDINQTEMPDSHYRSIISKISKYILENNSIDSICYDNRNTNKNVYPLARIRGNVGTTGPKDDFYSMVQKDNTKHTIRSSNFGLEINSSQEANVFSYLTTFIVRFALSINKLNANVQGEMKMIPLVDLNRSWTDADLRKEFGITDEEYAEILKVIPAYY